MARRAIFALVIAAVTRTAYAGSPSPIVGGSEVPAGMWPDAVAVLGASGSCTGTLIAPNVVLTAGHCAGVRPAQVIANTIDYASDRGVRVQVAKTAAYPSWQTSFDVAVLVLASPVAGVKPRRVGTSCTFHEFARTTSVHLVGFGATDTYGLEANTQLRQAIAEVTDPDCSGGNGCKKAIAPGGEFVAGGGGYADSCFGDSGGPVYLDTPSGPVVIGAVSRGVDGAATPCGGGGIYVRTDKLIEWLEDTTGTEIAKDACDGVEYSSEDVDVASEDEIGCSATRGGGLGALGLVVLALLSVRRRPRGGPHRPQRGPTIA
jgi:secreted trypsin-like serine protease